MDKISHKNKKKLKFFTTSLLLSLFTACSSGFVIPVTNQPEIKPIVIPVVGITKNMENTDIYTYCDI